MASRQSGLFIPLFVIGLFVLVIPVWATPSAKDLLQNAKNATHLDCNTQHIIFRNTTIIQNAGHAPTTMVQVTEIYKKKPNLIKMITDDGVQKRTVISRGDGYLFVLDNASGKYMPIKSPVNIDPFQAMNNSLNDFASADVDQVLDQTGSNHYEITVRGGKLPKSVDHTTLTLDPQTNLVTHAEGKDKGGATVLSVDATYEKIGNVYHPKHTHTESHAGAIDVSSDMDVISNEIDGSFPEEIFQLIENGK